MYKKSLLMFWALALGLSACGTLDVKIDQTATPTFAQIQPAALTPTLEPTLTPTQPATENPASELPLPTFSDVSFYRVTQTTSSCGNNYQRIFPARVRQIYAHWDYANMRAGLAVRREWYRDGKLWLEREEPWDFAKYGAKGTISDISIYDFDAGLEPGNYELRLYIDQQPQFDPQSKIGFLVDKDSSLEIASPNGQLTAIIADPQKLIIREADGTKWERLRAHEISSLAWFPDGKHILYTDTDRSQQTDCSSIRRRYRLWIVDASTGAQQQIGSDDDNLHGALLSLDGRTIAAESGSGYGDACMVDLRLIFIELDDSFQQVHSFGLQDFAGIPPGTSDSIIYPVNSGAWQDNTHFQIGLDWTCMPPNNPRGIYLFDLAARQAVRTGDLPNP